MHTTTRVLTLAALACAVSPAAAQDTAHVVIVATTDVHGHAMDWDYVQDRPAPWGLVRAATVVDSLRRAYLGAVVLVDGGDLMQGNPFASYFAKVRPRTVHPLVEALNLMRYDAVAPGNHDFDFGLEAYAQAMERAAVPVVAANLRRVARDTTLFAPSLLVVRGGVRVGITGLLTPGVMRWNASQLQGRVRVPPVADAAAAAVQGARAAGAELVVAIVHAGLDGASSYDVPGVGAENEAAALARLPVRPDLVIVGHSHGRLRDSVIGGVHFVQPQSWARSVSVVHAYVVRDAQGARVVRIRADEVPLGDVQPDPVLAGRLREAHDEVRYWASQPVTVAEGDWGHREARVRDTPILDFVNEVQRRRAGTDLSAASAFTTAVPIGPGPVRLRDLAGFYPYENTLRVVRIDGVRLRAYLEHAARYFRTYAPGLPLVEPAVQGYDFDVVAGVSYTIDLSRPVGSRIRDLTFQGRAVTAADTFTLAVNSHRQSGAGGYTMLAGLPVVYDRDEPVRDLLAEAMRGEETLRAEAWFTPSWRIAPPEAAAAAIATFAPPLPARDTTVLRAVVTGALRGVLAPATLAGRPLGGYAAVVAYADSLAAACGCPVVRLDAGGAAFGTPLADYARGAITVAAFNAAGVDAATLGGGDLAAIGDALGERMDAADFPWVAANAIGLGGGRSPEPWTLVRRGGRSLAVIGVVDGVPPGGTPRVRGVLEVRDPAAAIRAALPAVRTAGADAVVVLGDFDADCADGCSGEAVRLAAALDSGSVHAVVGGTAAMTDRGITIAPVLAYGAGVTVLDVVRRADGATEVRARMDTVWADRAAPDSAVRSVVSREVAEAERALDEPVARLRFALAGEGDGELPLGRLLADAVRAAGRTEVAFVTRDAIRRGLPGGAVRTRDLYERFPSPERLATARLTGEDLLALLDALAADSVPAVFVSGITVRADPTRREGRRLRDARIAGGDRLDRRAIYSVTLSEGVLALPRFAALRDARPADLGITDREALTRYMGLLRQPVEAPGQDRWVTAR